MRFTLCNKQTAVPIDENFWNRAFNYASRELQIEHHHADIDCLFIPLIMERKVKFKHFSLGATGFTERGAMFYIVADALLAPSGRMIKTFFHELTHVKQLLMGELVEKARSFVWKGEKWDKREYAFAPWEVQANTFSDKTYEKFLRREVAKLMEDETVHAYHAQHQYRFVFPQDDVFRVTQELHRERDRVGENDHLAT